MDGWLPSLSDLNIVRLFKRLRSLLVQNVDYAEIQSAGAQIVWGIWIISPWSYQGIAVVLGFVLKPRVVAIFLITFGLFQIISVLAQMTKYRRVASLLSVGMWAFLAVVLGQLAPSGVSFPTSLLFLFSAAWGFFHIKETA